MKFLIDFFAIHIDKYVYIIVGYTSADVWPSLYSRLLFGFSCCCIRKDPTGSKLANEFYAQHFYSKNTVGSSS